MVRAAAAGGTALLPRRPSPSALRAGSLSVVPPGWERSSLPARLPCTSTDA